MNQLIHWTSKGTNDCTHVDSFVEEFARGGGVRAALQDDPLSLGPHSVSLAPDHLCVPGRGDDVDVEGLYDQVDSREDQTGVAVPQLGLHVLLQEAGEDQRHLGVSQAQGDPVLVPVPEERLLDVLACRPPENVVIELAHLLPHSTVQSRGPVLALLDHAGVDQAGHSGHEAEHVVEEDGLVLDESLHHSKVRPHVRLEHVGLPLSAARAGAGLIFPFGAVAVFVLAGRHVVGAGNLRLHSLKHGGDRHPGHVSRHELQLLPVRVLHDGLREDVLCGLGSLPGHHAEDLAGGDGFELMVDWGAGALVYV